MNYSSPLQKLLFLHHRQLLMLSLPLGLLFHTGLAISLAASYWLNFGFLFTSFASALAASFLSLYLLVVEFLLQGCQFFDVTERCLLYRRHGNDCFVATLFSAAALTSSA